MADLAGVSNPYLSQIERGLHEPSVRILRSIAEALNISAETILAQAGLLSRDETTPSDTETAIRNDPELNEDQKLALLSVYRSYRASWASETGTGRVGAPPERGERGSEPTARKVRHEPADRGESG